MDNIVLLTVDSLRADHCGFLGAEDDLTPTLDDLAEKGVVFEHAISPGPRTPSSMPVIFTGEFVQEHNLGVYDDYEQKSACWMDRQERIRRHVDRFQTIPEQLQEFGYDTAGVTANPWTTPSTGFNVGFDIFHPVQEYDGVTAGSLGVPNTANRFVDTDLDKWLLTWPDFYDLVLESREELSEPYFLWVFLLDPHQPYLTPRQYRQENSALGMYYSNLRYNQSYSYTDDIPARINTRLRQAYRDTVRSVDAFVDQLLSDLAGDDPVTVFHADHGESFGDHGAYGHRPQLYLENVHVPLIIHNTDTPTRVEDAAPLRALPKCLTDIATKEFHPDSLAQPFVVSRTEECERTSVRSQSLAYITADEGYKEYLHGYQPEELYRLTDDPDERHNIINTNGSRADLLQALRSLHQMSQTERSAVSKAVAELTEEI